MLKIYFSIVLSIGLLFGQAQNALDFDGSNDYVQTATGGPTGSSSRTIECWIKTSASQSTQQVIFDYGAMSPFGSRFTLNLINFGKLRIEVGGNGFNSTQSIADGNWHHVAVSYDNSATTKFKMYIDGQLETSQNTTVAVNTTSASIYLGRRNDGVNYFDGVIDELRLWTTVRTAAQINATMNSEFCTLPPNLVVYYPFNQGVAGGNNAGVTNLLNGAGSNNGTLNNFALSGSSSNWVAGKTLNSGSTTVGNDTVTACDSLASPSGNYVWTTSGNYTDTITTLLGCDSTFNINLTLNNSSTGQLTTTACNSYTSPSGNATYTSSGTYTDILTNAEGCDSVLTINLTVNTVDINVLQNGITLTSWATGVNYQWLDCNNGYASIAGATSQTFVPTSDGSYAVELDDNGCIDTSACYTVTGVGLEENTLFGLQIHPNPARSFFVLTYNTLSADGRYLIYDISGKLLTEGEISRNAAEQVIPINMLAGVYTVRMTVGGASTVQKLIVY